MVDTQSQTDHMCGQHLGPKKKISSTIEKSDPVLKNYISRNTLLRTINIKRKNPSTQPLFEYKVKSSLTLIRNHLI